MNEDDTFNALRRIPILQLKYLINKYINQYGQCPYEKFYTDNGWKSIDYFDEFDKLKKRNTIQYD
jgi:hypothetical protein